MEFLINSLTGFTDLISGGFSGLFGYINELILFIATAAGALFVALRAVLGRLMIGLFAGLGRGAGTGLGARVTSSPNNAMGGGGSRMPSSRRLKRAREALADASARHQRMSTYSQAWNDLLALRGGPHGASIFLLSLLDPGFQNKVDRLRIRCRTFDQLEAKAQHILRRYERDYEKHCEPLRNQIIGLELELVRARARKRRFFWRILNNRRWTYLRQISGFKKRLRSLRWQHFKAFRRLNLIYQPLVEPAFHALDHYEKTYLAQWVHSFEADLESFRMTVVSGRLLDVLRQDQHSDFRRTHFFDDLPEQGLEVRAFLRRYLDRHEVGYGPRVTIETLLECYLRLKLLRHDKLRERWAISLIWLQHHLPPPGALGIAHERYHHLGDDFSWQTRFKPV